MSISVPPAYTKALYRAKAVQNDWSKPVPAGKTWVVRTISIAYGADAFTEVQFYVTNYLVVFVTLSLQPQGPSYVNDFGYYGMFEGEQMHVITEPFSEVVDVYVSGYELAA